MENTYFNPNLIIITRKWFLLQEAVDILLKALKENGIYNDTYKSNLKEKLKNYPCCAKGICGFALIHYHTQDIADYFCVMVLKGTFAKRLDKQNKYIPIKIIFMYNCREPYKCSLLASRIAKAMLNEDFVSKLLDAKEKCAILNAVNERILY